MMCTRCGGSLQPDWTCQRCTLQPTPPVAPGLRPSTFKILVAAACTMGLLTLSALAVGVSYGKFRHEQPVTAQPTGSADAPESPATGLAVSGTTLTPAAAGELARTWFAQRDPAAAHNAGPTLKGLETGDAYRVDQGMIQQILCGCHPPKHLHELPSVRVVLPAAPVRSFVAQLDTFTVGQRIAASYTVVFVAKSGTWRAAIVALNGDSPGVFHSRAGQPASSKDTAYARKLLDQLGAYEHSARTTGHATTSAGSTWTGYAPTLASEVARRGQDRASSHGVYGHFSKPVVTSAYSFPIAEGDLVCGALTNDVALTAGDGDLLAQDAARKNWGSTLPPGNYRGLTQYFDTEVCMIVHPDGNRDVISYYGSQTDLTSTAHR